MLCGPRKATHGLLRVSARTRVMGPSRGAGSGGLSFECGDEAAVEAVLPVGVVVEVASGFEGDAAHGVEEGVEVEVVEVAGVGFEAIEGFVGEASEGAGSSVVRAPSLSLSL